MQIVKLLVIIFTKSLHDGVVSTWLEGSKNTW